MDHLPVEIIEKILANKRLSIQDVINFSTTCTYFRQIVLNSSSIWKEKFHENWPKFTDFFDKCYNNFFEEIQYMFELKKRILILLEKMSSRFYKKYQLSDGDFEEWDRLIEERTQTYHYIVSILTEIINVKDYIKSIEIVPLNTPGNKTMQYYASKVLRYMKQSHLAKVWRNYMALPLKQQTLEKGATFVAQWCQTDLDISEETIEKELDHISELVKQQLHEINPNHQLFGASKADLHKWKYENLDKSQWHVAECRQLIVTMREVMYSDLKYCGNTENYYMPENSLINKVLESRTGLPIILAIIYESVGRRLGLLFEPINFPAHFLLRFTEGEGRNQSVYYVDTFNGGDIMQKTACPYSAPLSRQVLFPVATATQVVERIVNNLELSTRQHIEPNGRVTFLRAILELQIIVSPNDLSAVVNLAKLYTLHKIDTDSLENFLSKRFTPGDQVDSILSMLQAFSKQNVENDLEFPQEIPAVQRTPDLKYAVGMIMNDNMHHDKCVIYGWNPGCSSTIECPSTTQWHNVNKQPYYKVLVEDGSYRYVPQEMLVPTSEIGALLSNKDLGRHFSHFFENHFVPNSEKEKEYPYDKKIRQKFYHEMQLSHYRP